MNLRLLLLLLLLLLLIIIIIIIASFSHKRHLMVFHWSLSDSKSSQFSRTLLADLNTEVWMASTRPPIFNCSSSLTKHLETVLRATITISFTITFVYQRFFLVLCQVPGTCFIFLLLLLSLLWVFTPALADGLLLVFEWQKISSLLMNLSHFSGHTQHAVFKSAVIQIDLNRRPISDFSNYVWNQLLSLKTI